ncbi:branched-chain amino acid transaminase [Oleiagrimonas soli]|uniref:Branched-chain-amino-acid aminotransferase n=1 Tax=Oleiagrimonas soli TaxID=1543381 RepID=A0A099CSH2_9GAMM|nr:branched-chain amino acid transaminase [Oleiagrimonas soli]KGI76621.1 branched-chain amino acid aminotransferase [Oleiagrimonas soli]MBB6184940.1 branched-chain amino acid aminotransferase [Oleiagrimonas soli]
MSDSTLIWQNGTLKPWHEATVHVSAHALHYGSSVFEGERVYATPDGPRFFRLADHTRRLFASARVYGIDIGYTADEIDDACREVVRANGMDAAYVRPVVFRGAGGLGILPKDDVVDVAILALPWGSYHGDAREQGADVCVSSWNRAAPNTFPSWAKAGGNYLNSQLIALEARRGGYAEGIALGCDGLLSEGAGENLFLVLNCELVTPPTSAGVLVGITRDSIIALAGELGIPFAERALPREALLYADEIFLCGTAAEITPVRTIDGTPVGHGGVGPITRALQDAFFGLFDGRTEDRWGWLTGLDEPASTRAARDPRHAESISAVIHDREKHKAAIRGRTVREAPDPMEAST